MLYDVTLKIDYDYETPVAGGHHLVRVAPRSDGGQRLVASSLTFDPLPAERTDRPDFFANPVTSIAFREPHERFEARMTARVMVDRYDDMFDMSPDIGGLRTDLDRVHDIGPGSPHHFLAASPRVVLDADVADYARQSLRSASTVKGAVADLCRRIHQDFTYDPEATEVQTSAIEAFVLRRGVCQDFAHIMISGLRSIGVPAGYVSGYLRTIPPPGRERLEGADSMHAWVRAWCGAKAGWVEFDPTNNLIVANDHIAVAHGRDYLDVSPIVGVLKTFGSHETSQSVDVVPVEGGTRAPGCP